MYQVKIISTNLEVQHKICGDIINRHVILYCVNLNALHINVLALFLHVIIELQSSALCTLSFKYFNWYVDQLFDDDFVQE